MAVNQERVNAVCNELAESGKKATLAAVREALGEGSFSTIGPMVQAWKAGRGEMGAKVATNQKAVVVPDVVQAAGDKMMAEIWAMAEKIAAERLSAERATMEAARAEMAAELEAAYAEMETLREQLAKAHKETEIETSAVKYLREENKGMEKKAQALQVELAAAKAEAGAFKMAIEKINPKVNQEQPKKPVLSRKSGKAIAKSNTGPVDTQTAPLAL